MRKPVVRADIYTSRAPRADSRGGGGGGGGGYILRTACDYNRTTRHNAAASYTALIHVHVYTCMYNCTRTREGPIIKYHYDYIFKRGIEKKRRSVY